MGRSSTKSRWNNDLPAKRSVNWPQRNPTIPRTVSEPGFVVPTGSTSELHTYCCQLMERLQKQVDFEWGTLFLYSEGSGKLEVVAQMGDGLDFINSFGFHLGRGLSAWVAQRRKVVNLQNIHRGRRHGHHPVRSFVSLPITAKDKPIGVLTLGHVYPNAFSDREFETLETFVREIAKLAANETEDCGQQG